MEFMNSYKHLEKICGEIFNDKRCVSAYIDEMIKNPNGSFYVEGWNSDLKQLKHYRWVRNKIVHEFDCYEEDLCDIDDIRWLEDFYSRIMNQTDPLALYAQSISSQSSKSVKSAHNHESIHKSVNNNTYDTQHGKDNRSSCKYEQNLFLLACCAIIVVAVIFLTCKYR